MKETKSLDEKVLDTKVGDLCEFADKNGYRGSNYICTLVRMNVCLEPEKYMECIHYKQYIKDKAVKK